MNPIPFSRVDRLYQAYLTHLVRGDFRSAAHARQMARNTRRDTPAGDADAHAVAACLRTKPAQFRDALLCGRCGDLVEQSNWIHHNTERHGA